MKIYNIFLISFCFSFIFLTYSYPLYRNLEDETFNREEKKYNKKENFLNSNGKNKSDKNTRNDDLDNRKENFLNSNRRDKIEKNSKNNRLEIDETSNYAIDSENDLDNKKEKFLNSNRRDKFEKNTKNNNIDNFLEIDKTTNYAENSKKDYVDYVDKRYKTNNKLFFSKYSMNPDKIKKETSKKNVMISFKAVPESENYYSHVRYTRKKNKKWYKKVYKFFKNINNKKRDDDVEENYNYDRNNINKNLRDANEVEDKIKYDIFGNNIEEINDDSTKYRSIKVSNNNIYHSKRDFQIINMKETETKWYDDATEQFEDFYKRINNYTNDHIIPLLEAGKEKYMKVKSDITSFITFFCKVKSVAEDMQESLSNFFSFFQGDKEQKNVKNEDRDNSFFWKDEVKKQNKRHFSGYEYTYNGYNNGYNNNNNGFNNNNYSYKNYKNKKKLDEKKNKEAIILLKNSGFNISELQEIVEIKEVPEPPYWSVGSLLAKIFDWKGFSTVVKRSVDHIKKRSYDASSLNRYLRKSDFEFGISELVKGTDEWNTYNLHVKKMRNDELKYFKTLKNIKNIKMNSLNNNVQGMTKETQSNVKDNLSTTDETVHNSGRYYDKADEKMENQEKEFEHKYEFKGSDQIKKNKNLLEEPMIEERENNESNEFNKDYEDEKIYILDHNTLRTGYPQYTVKRQNDRFRSNSLLTELENFDSDEIFHHLTKNSRKKYSLTINKRYYWYTDNELVNEIYFDLVSSDDDDNDDDTEDNYSSNSRSKKNNLKKREVIHKLKKRNSYFNMKKNLKKIQTYGNSNKNSTTDTKKIKDEPDNEDDNDETPNKLSGKIGINNSKKLDKNKSRNSTISNPNDDNSFNDGEDGDSEDDDDEEEEEEEDDVVNMIKIDFVCSIEHFSESICNKTKNVINKAGRRISSVIDFPSTVNIKVTYSSYCKEFNECKTTTLGSSSPYYFYEFNKDFDSKRKKVPNEPLYYNNNDFTIDTNFSYPGALAKQRGNLNKGYTYDISLWLNGDWNWYFGRDQETNDIMPRQYDLEQVVIHEYLHGFGFVSSWYNWISSNDEKVLIPSWLSWNIKKGGYHGLNKPYIYNKYLGDVKEKKWLIEYQNAIINDFLNYPVFDSYTKVVNHFYNTISYNYSQKIYKLFTSPESVVFWCRKPVNKAKPHWVVLYTTDKYKPGSTISHLDSSRYLKSSGYLMRPSGVRNVILDEYKYNIKNHNGIGDDILCILGTLGYRIKYDPNELLEDIEESEDEKDDKKNKKDDKKKDNDNEKHNDDSDDSDDSDDYEENVEIPNEIKKKISETKNNNGKKESTTKKVDSSNPVTNTNNKNKNNNSDKFDYTNSIPSHPIPGKKKYIEDPYSNTISKTTPVSSEKRFKYKTIKPVDVNFKLENQ